MMSLPEKSKTNLKGKGSKKSKDTMSTKSLRSRKDSKASLRSVTSLRSKKSKTSLTARSSDVSKSPKSLETQVSAVKSITTMREIDYMKGKYRFRALVRKVLINVSWLLERPAEEEADDEGSKWARAMLRAKSRRRREGAQIFTWEEKVLFNRPPGVRSLEEIEKAYGVVQRMTLFKDFREEIQRGLAACLYFMYIPQNRTIIRQGHIPFNLYFIVQGDVLVNISRKNLYSSEMISETAAMLSRGDMFGEVALLEGIPRTATIITATVCEFLVLSRDDFMTVLQKTLAAQWKRFQTELARFSYFDALNEVQMREACILGRLRQFKRDETILGDGHGTHEYAYFLLNGTCRLVQTLTVEVWEEFGDTVYRLLDDPTLVAVKKLPETISTKQRIPSIVGHDLAAQDEWSLVALRLESAIGTEPSSLQWKKARGEVERLLEKEEPFKHKTVVHDDPWDQARQRVLETLGSNSTRAHLLNRSGGSSSVSLAGSIGKGEGSNELLQRAVRRRSSLGGGSATLMGAGTLADKSSPTAPLNIPSGPDTVHGSVVVDRGSPVERRSLVSNASASAPGLNVDRNEPFMEAARASVLGQSASFTRASNVSRFSTVQVTDGRSSIVPMPGFGPYGPALLRLAQRAGAIGAGFRGMETKKDSDVPPPKPHRIELVRDHQEKKESSKWAMVRLDHFLNHFPFKIPRDFRFSGKRPLTRIRESESEIDGKRESRENFAASGRLPARETQSDLGKFPRQPGKNNQPGRDWVKSRSDTAQGPARDNRQLKARQPLQGPEKDTRGELPGVEGTVKAFGSDNARQHSLRWKYAFEDPFRWTPKPRRISVASRHGIRAAWMNAVMMMQECLDRCEQAAGDPKRVEIMVDFWRKSRVPIERLMKKEHTPVMEPHHHLDCHFVQVCFYTPLAVFGIGECMDQRRVVATAPVECLLLPRYWLDSVNTGNVWDRVRLYLNRSIPDSKKVFRKWADERRWLRYRSHLVTEQINKRYVESGTTPYDVPYSLRLGEVTDPHARGFKRRYVIRPQHAAAPPPRLSRRITRPLV